MTSWYTTFSWFTCKLLHKSTPLPLSVQLRYCQWLQRLPPVFVADLFKNERTKRRRSKICGAWFELHNCLRTIGHESTKTDSSSLLELQTLIPKFATPCCDGDLHAQTIDLARSANDRFSSTTSCGSIQLQGSRRSSGQVDPWISNPCLPCTSVIQHGALVVRLASIHTSVHRSPEHTSPSNCVTCPRAIQVSNPYDLAWPLSWSWLQISAM